MDAKLKGLMYITHAYRLIGSERSRSNLLIIHPSIILTINLSCRLEYSSLLIDIIALLYAEQAILCNQIHPLC